MAGKPCGSYAHKYPLLQVVTQHGLRRFQVVPVGADLDVDPEPSFAPSAMSAEP